MGNLRRMHVDLPPFDAACAPEALDEPYATLSKLFARSMTIRANGRPTSPFTIYDVHGILKFAVGPNEENDILVFGFFGPERGETESHFAFTIGFGSSVPRAVCDNWYDALVFGYTHSQRVLLGYGWKPCKINQNLVAASSGQTAGLVLRCKRKS